MSRPQRRPTTPLLTLAALALACLATPAAAHHVWLLPADARPAVGDAVPVDLRIGHRDPGERLPRAPDRIRRFALLGPGGETAVPGVAGTAPAGIARPAAAGDHAVVYRGTEGRLELPAAKFHRYLEEQGLDRVVARRAALGEAERPGRELFSRSLKTLITAGRSAGPGAGPGAGDGPSVHLAPTGLDLELVPATRPAELAPGDDLTLRLLWRGAPRAGVRVTAAPVEGADDHRASAVTGADGRVRFRLPVAGPWQLTAVVMERAEDREDAEWRSVWTSLTLTVTLEDGARMQ